MLMYVLNVAVGITFSRGIIDFTFFGLLQGNAKTSYYWILILGPVYALVYYFVFKTLILKFNILTPGRGDSENKLYTRKDYNEAKENTELIDNIVVSLGGAENIENIDACITRLRVTVKDASIVADDARWKELQAKGVIRSGKGIQVVYGTQAETYKNQIRENHFTKGLDYLHLSEQGSKIILSEYDKRLKQTIMHKELGREVSYRYLIRLECYKLIKHLYDEKKYDSFVMWW